MLAHANRCVYDYPTPQTSHIQVLRVSLSLSSLRPMNTGTKTVGDHLGPKEQQTTQPAWVESEGGIGWQKSAFAAKLTCQWKLLHDGQFSKTNIRKEPLTTMAEKACVTTEEELLAATEEMGNHRWGAVYHYIWENLYRNRRGGTLHHHKMWNLLPQRKGKWCGTW